MTTQELQSVVDSALKPGADKQTARQFAKIEASLTSSFHALPKIESGGLAPRAVRHLVHSYFAKEHGWLINGLEFTGMRTDAAAAAIHDVQMLQDKAPAIVEAMLEAQTSDRGLSLHSVAAMVLVLERLIYDESLTLLESVYALSGISKEAVIPQSSIGGVLLMYLALFRRGPDGRTAITEESQDLVRSLKSEAELDSDLVDFQHHARMNFDYKKRYFLNPFMSRRYSFSEVRQIVDDMAEDYGKWQDKDCKVMKAHLMSLDPSGSGRIPLTTFHAAEAGSFYWFNEPAEHLRELSALEESRSGNARVLIANYLASPANCLPASSYYSICCLQECELLMNELESKVGAPTAKAGALFGIVSNMSSSSEEAPRQLAPILLEKLYWIAARHGGEIPLHGRLFRQWLHYAFPYECPMPQDPEAPQTVTFNAGEGVAPGVADTSEAKFEEMYWSEEEVLPLHEEWIAARTTSGFGFVLRTLGSMSALCGPQSCIFVGDPNLGQGHEDEDLAQGLRPRQQRSFRVDGLTCLTT